MTPIDKNCAYVTSLMDLAVVRPGKFSDWIAPPAPQPGDFEYVRFN